MFLLSFIKIGPFLSKLWPIWWKKIGKKGHISGTIGPIRLKIKIHKYFQVTSPPQGMRLCSKIKDTQDFIYLKYLEKLLQRYRAGSIRRFGYIEWGAHIVFARIKSQTHCSLMFVRHKDTASDLCLVMFYLKSQLTQCS